MEQALSLQGKIDQIPERVAGTNRNFKNEVFALADRFSWDYAIWQASQLAEAYRLNASAPDPPPPPPPTRNTARPTGKGPSLPAAIEAAYLNGEITLEKAQQLAEELKRVPENIGTEAEMYRPSRTVGEAIARTNRAIQRSQEARLGLNTRPTRVLGDQDHARDLRLAEERRRIEDNLARRRTPEFIEYCRTHPNHPDCQQMDRQFKRLYGESPPPASPPKRPAPPPVELVPPPAKLVDQPPVAFEPPPVAVPMPPPRDPNKELAERIGGDAAWKEYFDKLDDAGRKRLTLTWCQAHPEYEPCWKLYGKQLGGDFDLGENTFKFQPGDRLKLLKEWCRTRPNHEACRERTLGAAGLN